MSQPGEQEKIFDPTKFDEDSTRFMEGKYIFRFPFVIPSIRWGIIMGGLFSLNTFYRSSKSNRRMHKTNLNNLRKSLSFYFHGLFLCLLFQAQFCSGEFGQVGFTSVQRQQDEMLRREYEIRGQVLLYMTPSNFDIPNDQLLAEFRVKQKEIAGKLQMINSIVEPGFFSFKE